MKRTTLAETLTALAQGATPQDLGLHVTDAQIDLPLVISMENSPDGPVFLAHPPYSAFRSGVEPVVHRARMTLSEDTDHFTATPIAGPDGVT